MKRNAKAVEDSVMNYITAAPSMSDVGWGGGTPDDILSKTDEFTGTVGRIEEFKLQPKCEVNLKDDRRSDSED